MFMRPSVLPLACSERCYNFCDRASSNFLMLSMRPNLLSALITGLLCVLLVSPSWAAQRKYAPKAAKQAQPAAAPTPAPEAPPQPLTLAQQPATLPQVSFQNGQLTIVAQNSTLRCILRANYRQTSVNFDVAAKATRLVSTK